MDHTVDGVAHVFPLPGTQRSVLQLYSHLFFQILLFCLVSFVALFYSLGYAINSTDWSLVRTGLLEVDSGGSDHAEVLVDGQIVSRKLPYRKALNPGKYTVEVRRTNHQSLRQTVVIEENRVTSYKDVTLIRTEPIQRNAEEADIQYLRQAADTTGIVVISGEIWVDGELVTRLSQNILTTSWYPDRQHIIYQTEDAIWLLELKTKQTQKLVALTVPGQSQYRFKNDGRRLVYTDGLTVRVVDLY
jgi:hypothetical protein